MLYEEVKTNSKRWLDLKNLLNEIWRDVQGYEGVYQVSNYGRVKSLERKLIQYNGYGNFEHNYRERIMKLNKNKNNYLMVNLAKNCKRKLVSVHRLVAEAFIPNPNNYPCVNHKKPVTKELCDNRVCNLERCTQKENVQHCIKLNRRYDFTGEKSSCSKKVILLIGKGDVLKEFVSLRETAQYLNVSKATVCLYLKNKIKKPKHNIIYKEE